MKGIKTGEKGGIGVQSCSKLLQYRLHRGLDHALAFQGCWAVLTLLG